LRHDALIYANDSEYLDGVGTFVRGGLEAGEAVLVAVPGERHSLLRDRLGAEGEAVELVDMRREGKNPARILPFIQAFLDARPGVPVRFVGEPIWAGRTAAETVEGHRHEALINPAFAARRVHIVCPYDASLLDPAILEEAERTHPTLVDTGGCRTSTAYADPLDVYAAAHSSLPEPASAVSLVLANGLRAFRHDVTSYARYAGLQPEQVGALALAAHEAAANSAVHGGDTGVARIWHDDLELICEIADSGQIEDPLVGRRAPLPGEAGARGVWLINQLCDLVELRSGSSGTVVRMHMDLP
jgi:anti-sigma regulatory factor (Ser/Thr protein kinase)